MARVIGVDIPNDKRLEISLTYIFGVGRKTALDVCRDLNLDPGMKSRDLNEEQVTAIATHLQKNYNVEGELRRSLAQAITRLRDIGCYRGPFVTGAASRCAVKGPGPTPVRARDRRRRSLARSPSRSDRAHGTPKHPAGLGELRSLNLHSDPIQIHG